MSESDDMQIREALERLRDRTASSVDVEARLDEFHARAGGGTVRRRWGKALLAAAALIAIVAGSVVVLRGGDESVVSGPADRGVTHDQAARKTLERAVQATRDAPAWVAVITNILGNRQVIYQTPDRIQSETLDHDGNRVAHQIIIGTDMWAIDDGAWVTGQTDWRTVAPFTLLDALAGACTADVEGELIAWDASDGCDHPLDEALEGTDVWSVQIGEDSRISRVATGEVQMEPVDPDAPRSGFDRLAGLPLRSGPAVQFRYDDVPEVTVPPEAAAAPGAPNEAQTLAAKAFAALGWTPQALACCVLEPGSAHAQLGVLRDTQQVPIVGSPTTEHTFDHEGSSAVFVRDNDHVVDTEPVDLSGAPGVVGDANGYPFAAFTCGGSLWTVGGLLEELGPPVGRDEVLTVAADFAGVLDCEPGERPVAPGHGDPTG